MRTPDDLAAFLSRHAAFVAQKCSDSYCRAKVGTSHFAMAEEQTFKDANAICRWEGYAEMLAAMMALTGRALVDAGAEAETVDRVLHDMYVRVLDGHPRPAHRAEGWGDMIAALPGRLKAARAHPVPRLVDIAGAAGKRLFEVLPIHARYRELDEEIVVNSVTFQFVGYSDKFRRQVDVAAIARSLGAKAA
ncbi:MAG: hypothetical protein L6R19_14495 [Alphaproteobacteria bacterium]|nr:hypothetical protein [Alphaproteobacteria bacterium]